MAFLTLQEACEREIREGATQVGEVIPGQNVYVLVRDPHLYRHPYISTYATVVGETKSGKVHVDLYAAGSEKRLVQREAIFTRDSVWCRGEPIASVCHSRTHLWGIVYCVRRTHIHIYPLPACEEQDLEAEQVLADFHNAPQTFQEVEPESIFRKELHIVVSKEAIHYVRAEALLHRDWDERYTGGYVVLSEGTLREELAKGAMSAEQAYVSTFLLRKTLHFAVRDAVEVFFIDSELMWGLKREKTRCYYLVLGSKIYAVRQCWEEQLCAYLRGELDLDDLLRYSFVVSG